jgi:hypothetical protein
LLVFPFETPLETLLFPLLGVVARDCVSLVRIATRDSSALLRRSLSQSNAQKPRNARDELLHAGAVDDDDGGGGTSSSSVVSRSFSSPRQRSALRLCCRFPHEL